MLAKSEKTFIHLFSRHFLLLRQQQLLLQFPLYLRNNKTIQPQHGIRYRHQPVVQPLCQDVKRKGYLSTRKCGSLHRPVCRLPLQDRPRRPLLQGIQKARIHLGWRLDQPKRLPTFREGTIKIRPHRKLHVFHSDETKVSFG